MKKILLISAFLTLIIAGYGCKIKLLPDDSGKGKKEQIENKITEKNSPDKNALTKRNKEKAPPPIIPRTKRTTGKIYTPGPEGVRPVDAVPGTRSPINLPGGTKTTFRNSRPQIRLTTGITRIQEYWYECSYYGDCWDSENYNWYDCYYDAYAPECEPGQYWTSKNLEFKCNRDGKCTDQNEFSWYEPEKDSRSNISKDPMCCDSWGNCYNHEQTWMADPKFMQTEFCDECGNCYDYYGNFVYYDDTAYDQNICENYYYYYDSVDQWDICGNAYDKNGNFLFYDNYYYDYKICNQDYSACNIQEPKDNENCDGQGTCSQNGESYNDPLYLKTEFCDECGNCYDFYGNSTEQDQSKIDDYWCSQYYQYDKVEEWDNCGNAYDKNGYYLFYDNDRYDYKACYGIR